MSAQLIMAGAMVGLNLLSASGQKKANDQYRKIYKLQNQELENQKNFLEQMAVFNFKESNETYAENYSRLVEESTDVRADLKDKMDIEKEKFLKVAGKRMGVDDSSFTQDAQQVIKTKTEQAYRDITTDIIRKSADLVGEYTNQIGNINMAKAKGIMNRTDQQTQIYGQKAKLKADEHASFMNVMGSIAMAGATAYGDSKKSGGSAGTGTENKGGLSNLFNLF